jgi:hypothetical protein
MSRRRRKPAWEDRPSRNSSTATTALDGMSLYPTAHWFDYLKDPCGDVVEPDEAALVSANHRPPHVCVGCCASQYERAA